MHRGVVKLVVPDTRKALAVLSANYYGRPANEMKIVGVTGTNGKTTTSHILQSVLQSAGYRSGLIGTIEVRYGSKAAPATHTTPESLELQELFAHMRQEQCTAVAMEVSSHALHQSRVHGVPFAAGVFTNLTQDHLDYHGSMESYGAAKKILFDGLTDTAVAVVNADDPWSAKLTTGTKARVVTFGSGASSTVRLAKPEVTVDGSVLDLDGDFGPMQVTTPLVGRFNVENVLAATATGLALGIPPDKVIAGVAEARKVKGRLERFRSRHGWTAIVDYAHTPDALEKCLKAVRALVPEGSGGRVLVVFGAGGDRDRTKRPQMGAVAGRMADVVIVTSDNPRTEEPNAIIDEIMAGISANTDVRRESDRRSAIALAASLAHRGDIILVAGKGHEDYQVIGREKRHFSDQEVVEALA
jgi:UDP-N-acetylmuramoyl-L-alanyl-D-glutamate--2,6-diaminopimelate ligase